MVPGPARLLLLLLAASACGPAGEARMRTAPVPAITIDARRGDVEHGPHRYGTHDEVLLEVRHVNPFVHQYRISGTSTTYTENAIAEFAKALGVPITVPTAPTPVAVPVADATGGAKGLFAERKGCQESTASTSESASISMVRSRLSNSLRELRSYADATGGAISRAADSIRDPGLADSVLLERVRITRASAAPYADTMTARASRLADSVTSYNGTVAALDAKVKALADKYPDCADYARLGSTIATWLSDTVLLRGAVLRAGEHATAVRQLVGSLDRVVASPELTRLRRTLGGYDDPTVLALVVQRSAVGPDTVWRTIATPKLSFGAPRRFSIGIGATVANLTVNDYEVAHAYHTPPTDQPGDSIGTVVLESARSSRRVTPLISLNARLSSLPYRFVDGVHLLFGTAPRSTDSKLALDYMIGAALSGADERIMLGVGVVSAETQTLGAGYSVGGRIPSSQASVPVQKNRVERLALSLGFRVF